MTSSAYPVPRLRHLDGGRKCRVRIDGRNPWFPIRQRAKPQRTIDPAPYADWGTLPGNDNAELAAEEGADLSFIAGWATLDQIE